MKGLTSRYTNERLPSDDSIFSIAPASVSVVFKITSTIGSSSTGYVIPSAFAAAIVSFSVPVVLERSPEEFNDTSTFTYLALTKGSVVGVYTRFPAASKLPLRTEGTFTSVFPETYTTPGATSMVLFAEVLAVARSMPMSAVPMVPSNISAVPTALVAISPATIVSVAILAEVTALSAKSVVAIVSSRISVVVTALVAMSPATIVSAAIFADVTALSFKSSVTIIASLIAPSAIFKFPLSVRSPVTSTMPVP